MPYNMHMLLLGILLIYMEGSMFELFSVISVLVVRANKS